MDNEKDIQTDQKSKVISFFTHEYEVVRMERTNKRLWILCLVIFFAFVISNLIWIRYEMSMQDVVTTEIEATQDGGGVNIISGGDMKYGAESKDQNN